MGRGNREGMDRIDEEEIVSQRRHCSSQEGRHIAADDGGSQNRKQEQQRYVRQFAKNGYVGYNCYYKLY